MINAVYKLSGNARFCAEISGGVLLSAMINAVYKLSGKREVLR